MSLQPKPLGWSPRFVDLREIETNESYLRIIRCSMDLVVKCSGSFFKMTVVEYEMSVGLDVL